MKIAFLTLAAAAAVLSADVSGAAIPDAQQALTFDLYACARPAYPSAALEQGIGGTATIEVQVDAAGKASDARIASSSGSADLDEAALAAIRKCMFHVVLATGQAPTGWLRTQFAWRPGAKAPARDAALFASTHALAEQGDPVAQNQIGIWYEKGIHVDRDLAQAAAWYQKAAENNNAFAQNNLGVLHSRGVVVPGDPRQAPAWYARAAQQGHGWAQLNLAEAYRTGSAGERDSDKALYWLTRSAEGGLSAAQVRFGLLSLHRATSDEERATAAAWLARAAAQDDPVGHYYLGRTFELGLGNVQDDAHAAAAYRKALERTSGRAETALGILIDAGRVDAATPGEALRLYEQAMASRHSSGFYRYGLALERDGETALATALFRQAEALFDCEAAMRLAQMRIAQQPGSASRWRHPKPPDPDFCKFPLESEPLF